MTAFRYFIFMALLINDVNIFTRMPLNAREYGEEQKEKSKK